MKLIWAAVFFLFLAGTGALGADSLDDRIAQQKKQLELLNKRVEFHSRELAEAKAKERSYLKELSAFDHRVKQSEEEIELLSLQIQKNEAVLQEVGAEIGKRAARIAELQDVLAKRCVAIYKYGGIAELNVLISASDLTELNNLTHMMHHLADQDRRDIQSLEEERTELRKKELEQQRNKEELAQRLRRRERERESNKRAGDQRRELLAKIDKEKQVHLSAMKEIEEDQQAVQRKIDEYIKKKALEAQGAGKKDGRKPSSAPKKAPGKFDWPIPERKVTSQFGTRIHPKFKTKSQHAGIDIPSQLGTPIKAAAPGEVIYAGWLRGYGQIVIIDHGGGYSTVYAHMSQILTDEGKKVNNGTVIGKVGNTGVATGYHLHFEVRVNGTAQDPLKYLGK